jgi:nucleoside-diphosphate-sugar epimerase
MKILIIGATGYIGFNVALAFRRAGHRVFGLTRAAEKTAWLAQHEIHPIVGNMQQPESYAGIAGACEVLIHAGLDKHADPTALNPKTLQTLIAAGKRGPQPKTVIYTSGVWVYGNTGNRLVDETTPLTPAKQVTWRPAIEQMVLNATGVKSLVIRPGCVYGKQGGLTGAWFRGAEKDKTLKVVGDGSNRWAMVHADDAAEAFLRAAESGLSGEVFNLADRSRATIREMATAAALAAGFTGEIEFIPVAEAAKTMGDLAECLALDQHVDASKAARLLGWQPKHTGFVEDVETYFMSWKAAQSYTRSG